MLFSSKPSWKVLQEQRAEIRPAGEITCFLGEPGSVRCRAKCCMSGSPLNAVVPTRAQVLFLCFVTPGFWDFSLGVEIQTHKLYLEKSDDLRIVAFASLDFLCLVFLLGGVNGVTNVFSQSVGGG